MSRPISLLQGFFAAGDVGSVESFSKYLTDDVVVHAPFGLSTVGIEAEAESWRKAKAAIADLKHEFLDVLTEGDALSARCRVTGTMRGTYGEISSEGRRFSIDQALFAHVHNGRISELWEIVDTAALMIQLGMKTE